jgi:ornithine cyclodeaminase/alanine dehydrogenase-like protein (mu-crystallin family)
VNAVGACRPDWRELDDDLVRGARLYVESREAATRESGDVMAGTVVAEIGELVAGTAPGRQTEDEVTLFKSVGVAAEDIVAAALVYRLAGFPAPTGKIVATDEHR